MKKSIVAAFVLLLVLASCKKEEKTTIITTNKTDTTAVVKDETTEDTPSTMSKEDMEKAWMAYMTPTEPHKELANETGMWTTETLMWYTPDSPPEKSTGSAEIKMSYGGRHQIGTHKGTAMGQPFEGTSTVSYNNASKKYESTWLDNMGTGVMFLTGDYDAGNKTINFAGTCTDPMTGKEKTYRETWTIVDDNTRKMVMYDTDAAGNEFKSMEMTMKRK